MQEDKKLAATSGGAIGISAIASFVGLCCIGPWAVALLGVPGAIAMARWQPFRPYILGLATIMLAWSFWRVYGPAQEKHVAASIPLIDNGNTGSAQLRLEFVALEKRWLLRA